MKFDQESKTTAAPCYVVSDFIYLNVQKLLKSTKSFHLSRSAG